MKQIPFGRLYPEWMDDARGAAVDNLKDWLTATIVDGKPLLSPYAATLHHDIYDDEVKNAVQRAQRACGLKHISCDGLLGRDTQTAIAEHFGYHFSNIVARGTNQRTFYKDPSDGPDGKYLEYIPGITPDNRGVLLAA